MLAETTNRQEEVLVRMVQELLGSEKEDYTEDTILASDINRIRHLFYILQSEARTMLVQYSSEIFRARVKDVEGNLAELEIPGFEQEQTRRCRIKFEIANLLYEFEVPILEFQDEACIIRIPAFLQSAHRRGEKRLYVDDLYMRFIVMYTPLFGRRGIGQMLETRFPFILMELEKDEPDLPMLNIMITEEILRISSHYEIVFYEEDRKKNLMEILIEESSKTLFIRDTRNLESYFEAQSSYGMINYHAEYAHMMRYDSEEAAAKYFEELRRKDQAAFLTSYVCAPLMIFDSVVGHIYLQQTVFDRLPLDRDEAFTIYLLSRLLSYAMSKTVLARSYYRHTYTRILNISRSGLLFELNNQVVFDYLTYHDRLKMEFSIKHHNLSLKGEITRFVPSEEGYNVGVRFFAANPDDYLILENFIYSRSQSIFA